MTSKTKKKLRKFSVLLRYPDYASCDWPDDYYFAMVKAVDETAALHKAQRLAWRANKLPDKDDNPINDPDDFSHIATARGHVGLWIGDDLS